MVTLLRKLFIKNYKDVKNSKVRTAHGKLAAIFGIVTNSILFCLKMVFGFLSKSISIIADSINNLSDFGSSIVTLVGFKISSKPADKKHPFGHQRFEYIAGLIVSIIIVALSALLLYNSIEKIIEGSITSYSVITLIILGISILIKIVQAIVNFKISKIISSVALKATAIDSLTDSIATTILFISALLSYLFSWNIDGYVGIVIALFVAFSGIKMIIETSSPLMGEAIKEEDIKKVVDTILSYKGVLGVHDLLAHNYGPSKIFMSIHVEVDSKNDVMESHELIDKIENDIKNEFDIELTIHMDPIDISNPETLRLKQKAVGILYNIDDRCSLHDFRVVHGKKRNNVIFDVVVPYEDKINIDELKSKFDEEMNKDERKRICLIIHIDHPFVSKDEM